MVAAEDRLALLVEDDEVARLLGIMAHVGRHAGDLGIERRLVVLLEIRIADRGVIALPVAHFWSWPPQMPPKAV